MIFQLWSGFPHLHLTPRLKRLIPRLLGTTFPSPGGLALPPPTPSDLLFPVTPACVPMLPLLAHSSLASIQLRQSRRPNGVSPTSGTFKLLLPALLPKPKRSLRTADYDALPHRQTSGSRTPRRRQSNYSRLSRRNWTPTIGEAQKCSEESRLLWGPFALCLISCHPGTIMRSAVKVLKPSGRNQTG